MIYSPERKKQQSGSRYQNSRLNIKLDQMIAHSVRADPPPSRLI
jgi:hypothetical protein